MFELQQYKKTRRNVAKDVLIKQLFKMRESQPPKKTEFLWREKSREGAKPFPKLSELFAFFPVIYYDIWF
jgi:hypothetical protein